MNSKNSAFENSLACLQHPLTLLSIAVLLLNDHVLKIIAPSWWTGKLSDFAGLFFFPFIVAAGLSLALAKFDLSRQRIGQIAFGVVAVWFVLLKTVPFVNSLTAQVASMFVGGTAQLILDPTDLMALVVMWPGCRVWQRSQSVTFTRFAYVALSIGALAAMATSPIEYTLYSVTNLEYYKDGIVYAGDRSGQVGSEDYYPVATSLDGGLTWKLGDGNNVAEKSLPVKYCSHQDQVYCVRLTKSHQLEETFDNGENWSKVELGYIFIPDDLILFEWEGKEYIIVAIGEQGILRRELPGGDWEKIPVLRANK